MMYAANLSSSLIYRDTPNSSTKKTRPKGIQILDPLESSDESEPEIIQEASRLYRAKPTVQLTQSPYHCQEIGPKLDLGFQWPILHPSQSFFKMGFVRLTRENRTSIQRELDKIELNRKRLKNKNRVLTVTVYLTETFASCNPKFNYTKDKGPKRILTKPSKPFRNEENDNVNYDYILKVNDILGQDPNYQYRVIDLLGQGTFGQVVKCQRISTGELVSVKVIKNKSAYKAQSCMEIEILKKINKQLDPEDKHHVVRLHHVFTHKHHLCLVFELLSYNLYDLIGHNGYKGFPIETVRAFAVQILDTLSLLKDSKIIHCDLKPENILIQSEKSISIKVIDFGSSCHEANRIYTYIQSRFYRSPEVLLGMRYTGAIDMWSFGCIVAELFLGLPLFPGSSEYNQIFRIVEMLGLPPKDMLSSGRHTKTFFNKRHYLDDFEYELKSREQYSQENNKNELPRKKYFPQTTLEEIIMHYNPFKIKQTTEEIQSKICILDFLSGILELNPLKRWTPLQALQHPFITQKPYTGPFRPDHHLNSNSNRSVRKRAESMGKPSPPEQLQMIAQRIRSPIAKYPKEHGSSVRNHNHSLVQYRQRHAKSQGDYVGLLPPEKEKIYFNSFNYKR